MTMEMNNGRRHYYCLLCVDVRIVWQTLKEDVWTRLLSTKEDCLLQGFS